MTLSKEQRDALPATDFAVPAKRKLPIHDLHHVRLAWSQIGRTGGLTSDERAEGRQRILRRAHELGVDTAEWEKIQAMRLEAMAIDIPDVADHPNRMPFSGVLVKLDEPSDAAPHGSKGKRVIMSRAAAEAALDSLALMAVDITADFDGHDAQQKIGVITAATIEGSDLKIEGFVYAADFPEEAAFIKANKDALGFSFEAQDIYVESLDGAPLVITACVFTGAAILLKDKAAFTTTSLAASAAGEIAMTKEELAEMLTAALKPMNDEISAIKAGQAKLDEKIEAGKELHAKVAPHAEKLRAAAQGMQAAGIGVHSTRGHVAILNRMADNMEAEAMGGSLPHIYRDHDYAGGTYYAGADDKGGKADGKPNAEIDALKAQVADLTTKLADGISAKREQAKEPERKTLSPQITSLLAKAGVDANKDGEKMSHGAVDQMLASANLSISERIRIKNDMARAGLIDA